MTRPFFVALFLAGAAVSPAHAYNVLKNGDFSGGMALPNWNHSGPATWESYLGAPAGGSLRIDADAGSSAVPVNAHVDQCVDVHKWFAIDISLAAVANAEAGSGTHAFTLDVYDGFDCTGNVVQTISAVDSGTTTPGVNDFAWKVFSNTGTQLPGNALSAKMNIDTNAQPAGISYYLIDDVRVVPPDEIFPDAFDGN